jgi:hypothetical protein
MKSLLKGLSSPIDEFCAASLMITAQIARRTQLSQPLLYSIINIVVKVRLSLALQTCAAVV